jgi:hypothetical protein
MKQDPSPSAKRPRPKPAIYFFVFSKQVRLSVGTMEHAKGKRVGPGGI